MTMWSYSLAGEGDLDFLGRLALLGLDGGGAGDIDLGRGDGAGAGTGICLGGDREGLKYLNEIIMPPFKPLDTLLV